MKKVLVFVEYYLPGFKSGGPLQSIKNIVNILGEQIDFSIVTLDRDIGETKPYKNVATDVWCRIGNARVCYLSPQNVTFFRLKSLMEEEDYSSIYLNSFFSFRFSVLPTFVYNSIKPNSTLLIAPRGEFSSGALGMKSFKKKAYIAMTKFMHFYKYANFHASTDIEKEDIESVIGPDAKVLIAKDLPDVSLPNLSDLYDPSSRPKALRVCFISRLVPMKNLDYAIAVLKSCNSRVDFTIFGSKEDPAYWEECYRLLRELPSNVSWDYGGELHPSEVKSTFARFDVFLFPTRGENYGHVIAESLLSGTYVLLSDQTPWVELKDAGVGNTILLSQKNKFVKEIEEWNLLDPQERFNRKLGIQRKARVLVINDQDVEDNRALFSGKSF